jgi:flagellar protein FlgJ
MDLSSITARTHPSQGLPGRPLSSDPLAVDRRFAEQLSTQSTSPPLGPPSTAPPGETADLTTSGIPAGQPGGLPGTPPGISADATRGYADLTRKTQTPPASDELREAFHDFVGQTFFAEMIKACRSGQQPSAYFNGGRAEEIFQGQLDQVLSEELSESSADKIADPMFDLFMLKRQN